ncbi:hypothetical protein HG560_05805 [Helicobacter pylori]|uniref:Uncharacterized protein n=1 Tax=Helicobacter pylori TaxID=210 RepID=A0AAE7P4U5_HELPX|nr:hypothetical protein HPSH112_05945 [Helicobacter pylori Shi112]QQW94012.1 hypothetical protein HG560_05805 [Helicobacter pylori]QQX49981.1 hypothetical protein HG562_05820 [Helicobacter pylori]
MQIAFCHIKTPGSNQPFFLKNKNAQKRFLRLKTKKLVISQAEFLNNAILWALREKVISKYPLSLEKMSPK